MKALKITLILSIVSLTFASQAQTSLDLNKKKDRLDRFAPVVMNPYSVNPNKLGRFEPIEMNPLRKGKGPGKFSPIKMDPRTVKASQNYNETSY